jgi:hypothetical protein
LKKLEQRKKVPTKHRAEGRTPVFGKAMRTQKAEASCPISTSGSSLLQPFPEL